jgi:hypothetical protein
MVDDLASRLGEAGISDVRQIVATLRSNRS